LAKKPRGAPRPSRSTENQRRASPVADVRTVIIDAAERLCGERGLEAVSLRDIASEAGVNLSAINYYFGSRVKLLLTILQLRGAELGQLRRELLQQAATASQPDLREVLRAVLTPLARWRTPESNRKAAVQFICRALTSSEPQLKAEVDAGVLGFREVISLLQRAAPHLSFEDICWRFHFTMSIEHMNYWDADRLKLLSDGRCRSDDLDETLERAIEFAAAGFLARAALLPTRG